MLALRIRRGRLLDEDRRQQYLEDTRYASDE
jgi:hypothetical protein